MSRRKRSFLIIFVLCCLGYAPTLLLNGDAAPVSSPEILLPVASKFHFSLIPGSEPRAKHARSRNLCFLL